jgi:Ca2+-binding EF-hand superfamily protein
MISRRTVLLMLTTVTVCSSLPAWAAGGGPVRMFDTDNDGTIDLMEAKKAASAVFDRLDRDKDGTLDRLELNRRLSPKEFAAADPDHDGTLTKDEYLNAANPDKDGTLDAKELGSAAGKALLRLMR